MTQHFELVVAVRCHKWPHLVVDTLSSIFNFASSYPLVVIACDHNPKIASVVQAAFPQVRCYVSPHRWNWGAGLYGLLADTINWLDAMSDITYDHFLSIDYDTLILGPAFDRIMLNQLARLPGIGLAGSYTKRSANWRAKYGQSRTAIHQIVDPKLLPEDYEPGESCLGGFMWLTPECLEVMRARGYFRDPFRDIRGKINLYDDPWTTLLVRAAGFNVWDIKKMTHYAHIAWSSPGDWQNYLRRGLKVFNMAGLSRDKNKMTEINVRNVFRMDRQERLLLGPEARK